MTYDELEVGMKLVCNQTNGNKKELIVVKKGIDGFGREIVNISIMIHLPELLNVISLIT